MVTAFEIVAIGIPAGLLMFGLYLYHRAAVELAYRKGWLEGLDAYKKVDEKLMRWESPPKI